MVIGKWSPQGGPGAGLSLRMVLGFYTLLGAAALIWRLAADGTVPWSKGPETTIAPLAWRIAAGLGAGALLVVVSRAATARSRAGRVLADELGRLLGPLSTGRAVGFALLSGLAEEAFFRGALQPRIGWLGATLLFGAAHVAPVRGLFSWALFALAAGALFGALFAATGDLLAPFLAHALVNGLNLRWLAARARPL